MSGNYQENEGYFVSPLVEPDDCDIQLEAAGSDTTEKEACLISPADEYGTAGKENRGRDGSPESAESLIHAGQNSDVSIFIHELFHAVERVRTKDADDIRAALKNEETRSQIEFFIRNNLFLLSEMADINKIVSSLSVIKEKNSTDSRNAAQIESLAVLYRVYRRFPKSIQQTLPEDIRRLLEMFTRFTNEVYVTLKDRVPLNENIAGAYDALMVHDESKSETKVVESQGAFKEIQRLSRKDENIVRLKEDITLDERGFLDWRAVQDYLWSNYGFVKGKPGEHLIHNNDQNSDYLLSKTNLSKMLSMKASSKSFDNGFSATEHNEAVLNIDTIFESAVLKEFGPDKNGSRDLQGIERFEAHFTYDGDGNVYTVLLTAKKHTDSFIENGLYSLELTEIKTAPSSEEENLNIIKLSHVRGFDRLGDLPQPEYSVAEKNVPVKLSWETNCDTSETKLIEEHGQQTSSESDSILLHDKLPDDYDNVRDTGYDEAEAEVYDSFMGPEDLRSETKRCAGQACSKEPGSISEKEDDADTAYVKRWLGNKFSEDNSENSLMAALVEAAAKARGFSGKEVIEKYLTAIEDSEYENDPNVKGYTKTKKDAVTKQVKATIYAGKNADPTTFLHELHHAIMLMGDNMKEFRSVYLKVKDTKQFRSFLAKNMDILKYVLGKKDEDGKFVRDSNGNYILDETILSSLLKSDTKWTTADFEFEARLYEAYMRSGQTFNPNLTGFFRRVAETFRQIYTALRNGIFSVRLNDEIVEYYDKLYGYDRSTGTTSTFSDSGNMQFLDDAIEKDGDNAESTALKSSDITLDERGLLGWKRVQDFLYNKFGFKKGKDNEYLIYNKEQDANFKLSKTNLNKMLSKKASDKSYLNGFSTNAHNEAVLNVETLFENAVLKKTEQDKNSSPDLKEIERFETDFTYKGEDKVYTALFTAKKHTDSAVKNGLYSVELTAIKTAPSTGAENPNVVELSHVRGFDRLGDLPQPEYSVDEKNDSVKSPTSSELEAGDAAVLMQDNISSLSAEEQYRAVKAEYYGTDKYMIAPNGTASNLTERQWIQVRTPSFKAWFGDWENDTQNASKVLDENGEPLVVWHGSQETWDTFDMNEARQNSDIVGAYFTSDREGAEEYGYGAYMRKFFLSIKNPAPYDDAYTVFNSYVKENNAGAKARAQLLSEGYDGVIYKEEGEYDEYIVLNPNGLKSADRNNGEFSTESDSILFQAYPNEFATLEDAQGALNKEIEKYGAPIIEKGKIRMDVSTVQELYATAEGAQSEFASIINNLQEVLGLEKDRVASRVTLKKSNRVIEKAVNDYKRDIGRVVDVNGSTFTASTYEEAKSYYDKTLNILGDKVVKKKELVTPSGYKDFKINFKTSNGFIGELIILDENTAWMKNKGIGHKIYEETRKLEPYLKKESYKKYQAIFGTSVWESISKLNYSLNAWSKKAYENAEAIRKGQYDNAGFTANLYAISSDITELSDQLRSNIDPSYGVSSSSYTLPSDATLNIVISPETESLLYASSQISKYVTAIEKASNSNVTQLETEVKNKADLDAIQSQSQKNIEAIAVNGESLKQVGDEEWIEKVKRIAFKSTVTLKENAVKAYDPVMGLDDPANEIKRCARQAAYKESGRVSEKEGDGDIRFWNHEDNIIDLTGTFFLVKSGDVTSDDVKWHIKWLGGRIFETETGDLQIQITDENKDHVIKSNIPLAGNRKAKHDASLMNIGRIINHAKKIERDGTVDLSHNSRKQTLKHKLQVAEYVYFETSVPINGSFFVVELAAEKRKGQDENLLDLYNVKIEKKDPAGTQSVSQTGDNNRMSSIVPPVKLPADVNCSSFDDHLLERKRHQILSENPGKWTGDSAVIDEYREQRALYNGRSDFFRFDPDCLTVYTTETEPAYDNGSASCFTCDCSISVGYVVPDFPGTTEDISVLNGESIIVSISHEDEKRNSAGINLISPAYGKLYNSGIEKCFSEYVVGTGQLQRDGTLHRGLVRKNERCNFYTFATDSSVKEWMPTRDGWKTRSCNRVRTRYDRRAFFVNILYQQHTASHLKRMFSD